MSSERVDATSPVAAVPADGDRPDSGASWSAKVQVLLLTAVMGTAAVALSLTHLEAFPPDRVPNLDWWGLLVVFAAGEAFVIHLPAVRSAHSLTLRDIPAVVGLAFLSGPEYISAYVLGAALALLWSRQWGVKLLFNAAMFTLEASVGLLTYHAVLEDVVTGPRGWGAALAAVLLTDLMSAAAVTAAISLTERRFDDEVLREVMRSAWRAPWSTPVSRSCWSFC